MFCFVSECGVCFATFDEFAMYLCGMFVWCSLCVNVCIFTVSNALLISSATVIVPSGDLFCLNPCW